jgi:hypothetical protein
MAGLTAPEHIDQITARGLQRGKFEHMNMPVLLW